MEGPRQAAVTPFPVPHSVIISQRAAFLVVFCLLKCNEMCFSLDRSVQPVIQTHLLSPLSFRPQGWHSPVAQTRAGQELPVTGTDWGQKGIY